MELVLDIYSPIGNPTNIKTHNLCITNSGSIRLKAAWSGIGAISILIFLPIWGMFIIHEKGIGDWPYDLGSKIGYLFCFGFTAFGVYILMSVLKLRQFDMERKVYWKAWCSPFIFKFCKAEAMVKFDDIRLIQLIKKKNLDTEGDEYDSFELNLVLHNSKRVNVFDHGDFNEADYSLRTIAKFLKKEIVVNEWSEKANKQIKAD